MPTYKEFSSLGGSLAKISRRNVAVHKKNPRRAEGLGGGHLDSIVLPSRVKLISVHFLSFGLYRSVAP